MRIVSYYTLIGLIFLVLLVLTPTKHSTTRTHQTQNPGVTMHICQLESQDRSISSYSLLMSNRMSGKELYARPVLRISDLLRLISPQSDCMKSVEGREFEHA